MHPLRIRHATLEDGSTADVLVVDGRIAAVGATGEEPVERGAPDELDLADHVLLTAPAEPHAHLDKAFLAETVPNPAGDLLGAIRAMEVHGPHIGLEDTIARAERAVRLLSSNGVTAIRSHADLTFARGLCSVEALLQVRERCRDLVDLQVCALSGWPVTGPAGAEQRAMLREAISMGVDVVGGCPHLEDDPSAANETLLAVAAEARLPLDLHTDETLDPAVLALEDLARRVVSTGFDLAVTASHCVSLGMQPPHRQREVAAAVAAAGISVVALPQTNLFLQGRDHQTGMPRGLTAVRALTGAGVNVCAGADNLQDPFNPVGRGDPLETAALMVMVGHLLPDDAYRSVSDRARRALGLPSAGVRVGDVADLVAIPAASVREAVAMAPRPRTVIRAGRVVAGEMPRRAATA